MASVAPVVDLITQSEQSAPVAAIGADAGMFERLLRDPDITPERLERFMEMWERAEARKAEVAFNAAMSAAQEEMRPIATDATNPQTRSRYATYARLDTGIRPIYTRHGFGLSFDTGEGAPLEWVRVLCHVTHRGGHKHTYHADMPADGKGAKGGDVMTKTHATGAAYTYGMRYLLKMIFNIAVGEDDDDGNSNGGKKPEAPSAPAGYDDWLLNFQATADEGFPALQAMWHTSKKDYTDYLQKTAPKMLATIKAKAVKVKAS